MSETDGVDGPALSAVVGPLAVAAAGVKGPEPRDLGAPDLNEPVVVLLHGVLMNSTLRDTAVAGLGDRYRCIVPDLPFGAHTTSMLDDADLSLPALATILAEFLTELGLHQVPVVCNTGPAPGPSGLQRLGRHAVRHGGTDRVASLVLVSCEAFDNHPPGLAGRLL